MTKSRKSFFPLFIVLILLILTAISFYLSMFTSFSLPYPFYIFLSPFGFAALIISCLFVFFIKDYNIKFSRMLFAAAFFIYAFSPYGGYMFEGTNVGSLMMPILFPQGWVSLGFCALLVFLPQFKTANSKIPLCLVLLLAGLAIVFLPNIIPNREFLYLLYPNLSNYNIDIESGFLYGLDSFFGLFVLFFPLICIFTGILLYARDRK